MVLGMPGERVLGKTEVVRDNLDPEFLTSITLDYFFERTQQLLFRVYDSDSKTAVVAKADFLGEATATLAEIVVRRVLDSSSAGDRSSVGYLFCF
jgi:hypothetical protein